ncbi:MAG: acetate--CoA ligase family protein [Nevskiales bacterium]
MAAGDDRPDASSRNSGAGSMFADVSRLLAPRSIAVIGASDQHGNLGGAAVRFLLKFAAPCQVWPVNPGRTSVAGLACYPNVAALPSPADLAILAVPAAAVAGVVRDCAAAGITAGIAWAGGFVEAGEQGLAMQNALAALCLETGFALLGPNCIGIIDTHAPMTASFASMLVASDKLLPGNISMVSQSGGMATIGQGLAQQCGYGFRYMISTGNEAVLSAADFVHALVHDPETKVIAAYLEGARDGDKFRRALEVARAARKPVIVLKAGATAASAGAAAAHTGALAGEGRVWDTVLREAAAIPVDSLEELLDVAMQLSGSDLATLPGRPGVAAITFGGGSGVLAADQCDRLGLTVPPLLAETRAALKPLVPPLASTRNPVDFTPQAYADPKWLAAFPQALDTIAADPQIGTVFFQLGPMPRGDAEMAGIVSDFRNRAGKAVIAAWPLMLPGAAARLQQDRVHVFPEYSRGVRTIARLARYAEALEQPILSAPAIASAFDWPRWVPGATGGTVISEHDCHRILAAAGLPVAAGRLATSEDAAVMVAQDVGLAVAMKGISAAVTHREAAGLLALNIRSATEVRETYRKLHHRAAANGQKLNGIYVQHMVSGGRELLVSAFRDADFGVFVSVGAGGTMTEVIDDVVLAQAPLDERRALHALRRLRLLRKVPDAELAGSAALLGFITDFSHVAAAAPWRRFVLEVNPIKWVGDQVAAVDGLLLIEEP